MTSEILEKTSVRQWMVRGGPNIQTHFSGITEKKEKFPFADSNCKRNWNKLFLRSQKSDKNALYVLKNYSNAVGFHWHWENWWIGSDFKHLEKFPLKYYHSTKFRQKWDNGIADHPTHFFSIFFYWKMSVFVNVQQNAFHIICCICVQCKTKF